MRLRIMVSLAVVGILLATTAYFVRRELGRIREADRLLGYRDHFAAMAEVHEAQVTSCRKSAEERKPYRAEDRVKDLSGSISVIPGIKTRFQMPAFASWEAEAEWHGKIAADCRSLESDYDRDEKDLRRRLIFDIRKDKP